MWATPMNWSSGVAHGCSGTGRSTASFTIRHKREPFTIVMAGRGFKRAHGYTLDRAHGYSFGPGTWVTVFPVCSRPCQPSQHSQRHSGLPSRFLGSGCIAAVSSSRQAITQASRAAALKQGRRPPPQAASSVLDRSEHGASLGAINIVRLSITLFLAHGIDRSSSTDLALSPLCPVWSVTYVGGPYRSCPA